MTFRRRLAAPRAAAALAGTVALGFTLAGFSRFPAATSPTVERMNPSKLPSVPYLSQVVRVRGARAFAHIAGQTAIGTDFRVIGTDVPAQLRVALANMDHALEAAGAARHDLVRITVYYVDRDGKAPEQVTSAIRDFFSGRDLPAASYVGVPSLVGEGMLVEIEGLAVLREEAKP